MRRLARPVTFAALAAWGALAWGSLVAPAAPAAALAAVALGLATGPALRMAQALDRRAARAAARTALLIAQLGLVLLAAGAPLRLLSPDAWDSLLSGIAQGIDALPAISVPYRGADAWVRTVLLTGGGLLVIAAAWAAFGPGRRGAPTTSAALLGVLYGVAIVEHGPQAPFLAGAVFALLLGAYLWADRVDADEVGFAAVLAVAATSLAAVVAPGLDGDRPLLDYERLAESLRPEATATFSWTHDYGPLDWRRNGHEVLRVRARQAAYWKAANLDVFDGVRWRAGGRPPGVAPDTEFAADRRDWHQTITVVVRGLRSREYIGAGTTERILGSPRDVVRADPGSFVTASRPLRPGDDYRARVYTPRPSATQLRADAGAYPSYAYAFLLMLLPPQAGGPRPPGAVAAVQFPAWGERAPARTVYPDRFPAGDGAGVLAASRYARTYALAQRLRRESASPYDFVRRVLRRVRDGAAYTEVPREHPLPLEAFLFSDRQGYCQQFSGAMALLLRMGGVPARVAAGFAPGGYDHQRREYVVRDLDAHSWVEAYFPGYGWVPFDPTPSIAPPRSQAAGDDDVSAATGDRRDTGGVGARAEDPTTAAAPPVGGGGASWTLPVLLLGALALLGAMLAYGARRARLPAPAAPREIAELVRALRRTGRAPDPPLTLAGLERLLDSDDGYVRALREHRYAGVGSGPTPAQRRALRRTLAAGLGLGGRLRAWWALPPRWH